MNGKGDNMKLHRFDMENEGLSDPPMIVEKADGDYCDADDAMEIIEQLESERKILLDAITKISTGEVGKHYAIGILQTFFGGNDDKSSMG